VIVMLDRGADIATAAAELGDVPFGQLITPLTRRANQGHTFGIDNGAFARFDADGFLSLLERQKPYRERCKFVAAPDVVGSARRTLECFRHWFPKLHGWPVALVAQDGQEDLDIPWSLIDAVFIGGSTEWKLSEFAAAIIKAAQVMGKWVHVGRVNTPDRFRRFEELGVDSCDGTGISRYSWMRGRIAGRNDEGALFVVQPAELAIPSFSRT
jgi:hypothetical protein